MQYRSCKFASFECVSKNLSKQISLRLNRISFMSCPNYFNAYADNAPTEAMIAYCKEVGIPEPASIEYGIVKNIASADKVEGSYAQDELPSMCSTAITHHNVLLLMPKIGRRDPSKDIHENIKSVWFVGVYDPVSSPSSVPLFIIGTIDTGRCMSHRGENFDGGLLDFEKDPFAAMKFDRRPSIAKVIISENASIPTETLKSTCINDDGVSLAAVEVDLPPPALDWDVYSISLTGVRPRNIILSFADAGFTRNSCDVLDSLVYSWKKRNGCTESIGEYDSLYKDVICTSDVDEVRKLYNTCLFEFENGIDSAKRCLVFREDGSRHSLWSDLFRDAAKLYITIIYVCKNAAALFPWMFACADKVIVVNPSYSCISEVAQVAKNSTTFGICGHEVIKTKLASFSTHSKLRTGPFSSKSSDGAFAILSPIRSDSKSTASLSFGRTLRSTISQVGNLDSSKGNQISSPSTIFSVVGFDV